MVYLHKWFQFQIYCNLNIKKIRLDYADDNSYHLLFDVMIRELNMYFLCYLFGTFPGHADKIKSVMSSIQIPSTNIPEWARNLSEDQWQSQVVNKLVIGGTRQNQEVSDKQNDTNTQQPVEDDHSESIKSDQSSSDCS